MYLQYLPPKSLLLANMGCWEEYLADEECRLWQTQWRRITLDITRRWETEEERCTASNNRRRLTQLDADLGGAPSREVLAGRGVVSGSSGRSKASTRGTGGCDTTAVGVQQ